MSTRLGMADGRMFTETASSDLLNEEIATKLGISAGDTYRYRMLLQSNPDKIMEILQSRNDRR